MQCQDIYPELMEDLQKLVASPLVTGPTRYLSLEKPRSTKM